MGERSSLFSRKRYYPASSSRCVASLAPQSSATIVGVHHGCSSTASQSATATGAPAAPPLLLVLPDIDVVAQRPLQQLMHALSDLRQAGELRPALVVGATQHPDAVRPLLSAEGARAHAYMRPQSLRLPSAMQSLSSLVKHSQVNLDIPEILLGPHVLTCMARIIKRTELCRAADLLAQTLRLMLLRHHCHNPTAGVGAAVRVGDWDAVEAALAALPRTLAKQLAAEAEELGGEEGGRVGTSPADAKESAGKQKQKRKSATGATKHDATIRALRSFRQTLLKWQLALHWLHTAADATASESNLFPTKAASLEWWPLLTAASAPSFIAKGSTPGLATVAAPARRSGSGGGLQVPQPQQQGSTPVAPARQSTACFGTSATARAAKECCSAVARLPSDAALKLATKILRTSDTAPEACEGDLAAHLQALRALVHAEQRGSDHVGGGNSSSGGDSHEKATNASEHSRFKSASKATDKGRRGARRRKQCSDEPEEAASDVMSDDASLEASGKKEGDGGSAQAQGELVDAAKDSEGEVEEAGDSIGPDSAGNENGPAAQQVGNRRREARAVRRVCGADAEGKRGKKSRRGQSAGGEARATIQSRRRGSSLPEHADGGTTSSAVLQQADETDAAGAAEEVCPRSDAVVAEGEAPPRPLVRRGYKQTQGQFLAQQAAVATAKSHGTAAARPSGAAAKATVSERLAHVLEDAWLLVLQMHPSEHPCASVLYVDDGDYAVQTLAPSPRQDLHEVLSDPVKHTQHAPLNKGVQLPMTLTFTCTAYQLLMQYGRNVDVADWFESFCLALGAPRSAELEDGGSGGRGKKRKRVPKKRKKKMKTVERGAAAAERGGRGEGGAGPSGDGDADQDPARQCAVDLERGGEDLHDLYIYFYYAVKQLMYCGILKRSNRRTGGFWKREIFPPDGKLFW